MIRDSILNELKHEAEGTRKLFNAIPDNVLDYKPNSFNWTIAELASHTAEVYNWWDAILNLDRFDMKDYSYESGDISSMKNIITKLEENINTAIKCLEDYPEEKLMETWSMWNGDINIMPEMPRIQVIRSFSMNHLYHHRGELIAYLRANGKPVPGIYGPSYEEQMAMAN